MNTIGATVLAAGGLFGLASSNDPFTLVACAGVAAAAGLLALHNATKPKDVLLGYDAMNKFTQPAPYVQRPVAPAVAAARPVPRTVMNASGQEQQADQGPAKFLRFLGDSRVSVDQKMQMTRDILANIDDAMGGGNMARTFDEVRATMKVDENLFDATGRLIVACIAERFQQAGLEAKNGLLVNKNSTGIKELDAFATHTQMVMNKVMRSAGNVVTPEMKQSVLASAAASPMLMASAAMATEGTNEILGIDDNIQAFILVGGFAAIGSLYFTWATGIDDGEEDFFSEIDNRR